RSRAAGRSRPGDTRAGELSANLEIPPGILASCLPYAARADDRSIARPSYGRGSHGGRCRFAAGIPASIAVPNGGCVEPETEANPVGSPDRQELGPGILASASKGDRPDPRPEGDEPGP